MDKQSEMLLERLRKARHEKGKAFQEYAKADAEFHRALNAYHEHVRAREGLPSRERSQGRLHGS